MKNYISLLTLPDYLLLRWLPTTDSLFVRPKLDPHQLIRHMMVKTRLSGEDLFKSFMHCISGLIDKYITCWIMGNMRPVKQLHWKNGGKFHPAFWYSYLRYVLIYWIITLLWYSNVTCDVKTPLKESSVKMISFKY